jgi:hypothetical protein
MGHKAGRGRGLQAVGGGPQEPHRPGAGRCAVRHAGHGHGQRGGSVWGGGPVPDGWGRAHTHGGTLLGLHSGKRDRETQARAVGQGSGVRHPPLASGPRQRLRMVGLGPALAQLRPPRPDVLGPLPEQVPHDLCAVHCGQDGAQGGSGGARGQGGAGAARAVPRTGWGGRLLGGHRNTGVLGGGVCGLGHRGMESGKKKKRMVRSIANHGGCTPPTPHLHKLAPTRTGCGSNGSGALGQGWRPHAACYKVPDPSRQGDV